MFNRDSIVWTLGMLGGLAIAFAGHLEMFAWFPLEVQRTIEVIAFIAAVLSGKLATSPLPGKPKE